MARHHEVRRSAFRQWMYGDPALSDSDPLTDEQQQLFDRGFRKCEEKALRVARKVTNEHNAEDIVHSALAWLVFVVTRRKGRLPMPRDEAEFSTRLVRLIYIIGKASVDEQERPQLVHSHWGRRLPRPAGRPRAERLLTRDMADWEKAAVSLRSECDAMGEKDRKLHYLRKILIFDALQLGEMQLKVLQVHVAGKRRREGAKELGMNMKTYDNTLRRTKDRMRELVLQSRMWEDVPFPAMSDWMDVFAEMEQQRVVALFKEQAKARLAGDRTDAEGSAA